MLRHRIRLLAVAATALPCLCLAAAPACPPRPIVFGLYEFGYYYLAGKGLDKDVAEALGERSGCPITLRVLPRRDIWLGLQSGSVDMTLSAASTPERLVFSWATPYLWVRNRVILRADVAPDINSMDSFIAAPNLRLGTGRSHFAGNAFDDFVGKLRNLGRVEEVDDTGRLFAMLKAGRFQAVLASPMVYLPYVGPQLNSGAMRVEDWLPGRQKQTVNLLIGKKNFSQQEARRWGELLRGLQTDGTLERLLGKYADPQVTAELLSP